MPEIKPRYTVELTTEGWQIQDNERGTILADTYGSRDHAEVFAENSNRMDAAEGQGRR